MLNVPQTIKDLFKTDGVMKNIRISFPNGERDDICNDQIVKESLKFDESVSSREELIFGLCESSQLSFECAEVENIKGMEIEAAIEIDVTGHERTEYPVDTECPVFLKIEIDGNTYYVIVSDFPEIEAGQTYTTDDGTGLYYDTWTDENTTWMKMHFLNYAYYVSVVGAYAIYERKIYFYSTKEENFYGGCITGWTSSEHFELSFPLNSAFTDDEWLSAIHNMHYDSASKTYWGRDFEPIVLPDVPFPFYRIPLGRFVVDECKRDAKMRMRKVTAYSQISNLAETDWWTTTNWVVSTYSSADVPVLDLDIMNFVAATNQGVFDDSISEPITFSRTGETFTAHWYLNDGSTEYAFSVEGVGIWAADLYTRNLHLYPWPSTNRLGRVDKSVISNNYQSSIDELVEGLTSQGLPNAMIEQLVQIIGYHLPFNVLNAYRNPSWYPYADAVGNLIEPAYKKKGKQVKEGELFIMPWKLAVFSQLVITYSGQSYRVYLCDAGLNLDNVVKISEVHIYERDRLTVPIVSENNGKTDLVRSFLKPIMLLGIREMLEGNVELRGCFGRMGRDGHFQLLHIAETIIEGLFPNPDLFPSSDIYPTPLDEITEDSEHMAIADEDDTISLWYEEYFIQYGGIVCAYLSSEILDENDNPTEATYEDIWNNGERMLVYDISDNAIIKSRTYTADEIAALLAPVKEALNELKFYPSDVSMVGLPYIEAGDWVLAALYGNRVLTLCLSRTLSGIQRLTDKMKSN